MDKNEEFEIECWYDPGMLALVKEQDVTVNFPDGDSFDFVADVGKPEVRPATAWDRFKHRWFPAWLLRRCPVKWKCTYTLTPKNKGKAGTA